MSSSDLLRKAKLGISKFLPDVNCPSEIKGQKGLSSFPRKWEETSFRLLLGILLYDPRKEKMGKTNLEIGKRI